MIAVGVARPNAHGQLITSTLMPWFTAAAKSPVIAHHSAKVASAMAITAGTKMALMRSAKRSMGALDEVASSTRRMIPAKVVSAPTRSALMVNQPFVLVVAPVTGLPGPTSTGTLSPVMTD